MRTWPCLFALLLLFQIDRVCNATTTWDGAHDTSEIEVTMVYFVPSDRQALPDWKERLEYYASRISAFHGREFQGQSKLKTVIHPQPFRSPQTTTQLRQGDANRIFFRTLGQVDRELEFAAEKSSAFPILLVLSEINWKPLDDFYRLHPENGQLVFEGNYNDGQHFPGATSGGARATYLADRGVGWGLVSADGWRVPYRGSDCVVYHEGCGHTVGLPHPEPGNGSVMSLGQYRGWISESWLDRDQKAKMGWQPETSEPSEDAFALFSKFRAIPQPTIPRPGQTVTLKLDWPHDAKLKSMRVCYQTAVSGPWVDVQQPDDSSLSASVSLASFDRPTPVSYRVDVELENGQSTQLWGYFQVREDDQTVPQPFDRSIDLVDRSQDAVAGVVAPLPAGTIDLLAKLDVDRAWSVGEWTTSNGQLTSPKQYGARVELPFQPASEYQLTLIVQPLDEPNGLIVGGRSGSHRFLSLFSYRQGESRLSAIENVDGRNVGNQTTFTGDVFQKDRLSEVIVTVNHDRVRMLVDGHLIADWKGRPEQLSLGDYWKTPNEQSLFLGSYDCRYRFHRITVTPLVGRATERVK
ncbi:hypothetical protein NHH03_02875 [Stieleria sp. TO1_6]|uniref:hypothetical protein n=1 Tax=Stieleria tagensis TaxID=2956795 RepID=UPI00209B09A7|nr:hypothetical protein [Stieleria tagensis]MCO8120667.1 hypothetical protein [Stieleria tagensis]